MRPSLLVLPARPRRPRRGVRLRPDRDRAASGGREIAPAGVRPRHRRLQRPAPLLDQRAHRRRRRSCSSSIAATRRRRTGLATIPVNFAVVTGDVLFANEPRNSGPGTYCPDEHGVTDTITANAPFAISPIAGGRRTCIQAFYDYTGDFLPTFKFRNLPEQGDIGGGDVDTVDALKPSNAGNPNYQPHFLPVDVGIPDALPDDRLDGGRRRGAAIPNFTIPPNGLRRRQPDRHRRAPLPLTRPYFYAGRHARSSFDPSTGTLTHDRGAVVDPPPTSSLDEHRVDDEETRTSNYGADPHHPAGHRRARRASPAIDDVRDERQQLRVEAPAPHPPRRHAGRRPSRHRGQEPFHFQFRSRRLPPAAGHLQRLAERALRPASKQCGCRRTSPRAARPVALAAGHPDEAHRRPEHTSTRSSIKTQGGPTTRSSSFRASRCSVATVERPDEAGLALQHGPARGVRRPSSIRRRDGRLVFPQDHLTVVLATGRHLLQHALRLDQPR